MHENVGDWHLGCGFDWERAKTKLGGLTGMPVIPSAEDVQRVREQTKRAKRLDTWTEGIHIFPGAEAGSGSSEPARLKDSGNGAPATAVGDGGGEATVEAVGTEVGIQDGGPEEGRTAQDGGGDGVTSIQYRFQVQQAIVNRLYLFSPEDAADVQQLFRQYNRSTLDLAKASVRLLRANQALENLKRRR
ncbi:hypothetical protein MBLNU13_g02899t3 [Cladosporium sp. NU13]